MHISECNVHSIFKVSLVLKIEDKKSSEVHEIYIWLISKQSDQLFTLRWYIRIKYWWDLEIWSIFEAWNKTFYESLKKLALEKKKNKKGELGFAGTSHTVVWMESIKSFPSPNVRPFSTAVHAGCRASFRFSDITLGGIQIVRFIQIVWFL